MNYFKLIFVTFILFAFYAKANDVQIIELHKNKSLDQLVLEKENNKKDENNENNSINIENDNIIEEEISIIEDDSNLEKIDGQNTKPEDADEQIVDIENETFFDLDNSLIILLVLSLLQSSTTIISLNLSIFFLITVCIFSCSLNANISKHPDLFLISNHLFYLVYCIF